MTFHCWFSASRAGDHSTHEKEVYGTWIVSLGIFSILLGISFFSKYIHDKIVIRNIAGEKKAEIRMLKAEKRGLENKIIELGSERDRYKAEAEAEKGKLFGKDLKTFINKLNIYSKKNYKARELAIYLEGRIEQIETKTDDSVELMRELQEEYATNGQLTKKINYWSSKLYPTFIPYFPPLQATQAEQESREKN